VNYTQSGVNKTLKEYKSEATISLVSCATSAAPTYFPEVKWKDLTFWDGGLLNNNPIDQLWAARYDLVEATDPEPKISCVVSLGCGFVKAASPSESWLQLSATVGSVIGFATNTDAKGKDFSRHISDLNRRPHYAETKYFRFSVNMVGQEIGLADYKKMDVLKALTKKDILDSKNQKFINDCVDAIAA
jgi:predicted acylesterase/phospholipase RssA